jgi:hypothetical protein
MEAPFETEFLIRRIEQLWTQAAHLPEKSPAQAHIEQLACQLSEYVSGLYGENAELRDSYPDRISAIGGYFDLSGVDQREFSSTRPGFVILNIGAWNLEETT